MTVTQSINETYGEILLPSLNELTNWLKLDKTDVFVDLGSGKGQIVVHFFLNTPVKKSYGIEINQPLHQQALLKFQEATTNNPWAFRCDRELELIHGSFLTHPIADATVVLINATCFTQSLLQFLDFRIENTPSIHTVLTLRPLPNPKRLRFIKTIKVQCSWDSALCYAYCISM